MNRDYIEGAAARARKEDFRPMATQSWSDGFSAMSDLLAPIEQKIVLATFEYQSVAQKKIRELEEQFRECDIAEDPARSAFPSERSPQSSTDGNGA